MYPKLAKKYWSFCWSVKCWGHRRYFRTWVSLHVSPIRSCRIWSCLVPSLFLCPSVWMLSHLHNATLSLCRLSELPSPCPVQVSPAAPKVTYGELSGRSEDHLMILLATSVSVLFHFLCGSCSLLGALCLALRLTHSRCSQHICRTIDISEELCTRTLAMHTACIISLNKSRLGRMLAWSRMKAIKNSK